MLSVLKYGGQALASQYHLQHLIAQVRNHCQQAETPPLVVVSAMVGIEKRFHTLARLVREGHVRAASELLEEIKEAHYARAQEAVHDPARVRILLRALEESCWDLTREVEQLHHLPYGSAAVPWHITRVTTWGERLAVLLVAAALEDTGIHAQGLPNALVHTTQPTNNTAPDGILYALPLLQETRQQACQILLPLIGKSYVPVVAGGLARTRRGGSTSLGSQGADLTAALLAVALNVRSLIIATTVPGILNADPELVPNATPLRALSAEEACALLSPGARLLHPQVIPLLAAASIPLWIRSLLEANAPGTRVSMATRTPTLTAALALHPAVALLTFTGRTHPDAQMHLSQLLRLVSQIGVAPLMITLMNPTRLTLVFEEQAMEAVMEVCAAAEDTWQVRCQQGLAACHGIGTFFQRQPRLPVQAVMLLLDEGIPVISHGYSEEGMMLVVPAKQGAQAIRALHDGWLPTVIPSNAQALEPGALLPEKERG